MEKQDHKIRRETTQHATSASVDTSAQRGHRNRHMAVYLHATHLREQGLSAQAMKPAIVEARMMTRMIQHIMIIIFFCSARGKMNNSILRHVIRVASKEGKP